MGFATRVLLWRTNWELFLHRPLLGVGLRLNHPLAGQYLAAKHPEQSFFIGHAHNNILDILAGTGLVGITVWLFWWGHLLLICARLICARRVRYAENLERENWHFSHGIFCSWIVFHLNGLSQVNFWEGKVQHQLMWSIAWVLCFYTKSLHSHEELPQRLSKPHSSGSY